MPICAALFIFIPHMSQLWMFMGLAILFTFVMSIWRTPAVSLMPDLTPGPLQTQGNGIVNLMGGIGAVLAFAGGGFLFGFGGYPLTFLAGGVLLIVSLAIVAIFVREPKLPPPVIKKEKKPFLTLEENEKGNPILVTKAFFRTSSEMLKIPKNKSLFFLLFAIFFWFMGYNAVETFFSSYATRVLDVTEGQASIIISLFALALVVFAVPAGIIGAKIGRRKTILIGLIGVTCIFIPFIFITSAWAARILMVIGGMFWACVNINSLPMIVRMAGPLKIGEFIGYYYLFSFSSQIITTPIFGAIRDAVGYYQSLFIYAAVTFALAFVFLTLVRHGEEDGTDTGQAEESA